MIHLDGSLFFGLLCGNSILLKSGPSFIVGVYCGLSEPR
jgi:hypothetical protein